MDVIISLWNKFSATTLVDEYVSATHRDGISARQAESRGATEDV